jgi:hypothetical protein
LRGAYTGEQPIVVFCKKKQLDCVAVVYAGCSTRNNTERCVVEIAVQHPTPLVEQNVLIGTFINRSFLNNSMKHKQKKSCCGLFTRQTIYYQTILQKICFLLFIVFLTLFFSQTTVFATISIPPQMMNLYLSNASYSFLENTSFILYDTDTYPIYYYQINNQSMTQEYTYAFSCQTCPSSLTVDLVTYNQTLFADQNKASLFIIHTNKTAQGTYSAFFVIYSKTTNQTQHYPFTISIVSENFWKAVWFTITDFFS